MINGVVIRKPRLRIIMFGIKTYYDTEFKNSMLTSKLELKLRTNLRINAKSYENSKFTSKLAPIT